jgi:plastocyanin
MRKFWSVSTVVLVTLGVVGVGVGPAAAKTSKPVTLDGKVNNKGSKDISGKKAATLEVEADDYYFEPTFVKVQPGEKVRITLENEGKTTHTFTSDSLNIDQQVAAGKKAKFTVTVPSDGSAFQFHCTFHGSMGMQGAVYTKAGASVEKTSTTKAPTSGGGSIGY